MSKIIKYVCMQEAAVLIDCSKYAVEEEEVAVEPSINDEVDLNVELINSAKEEAATIVNEATLTATNLINEANQQAALIKQQAQQEGQQQGHEQGYQDGVAQGQQIRLAEMQQVLDQAIEKSQQILSTAAQESKEMILAAERDIVDIALAVARKILAYEIAENPMVALPVVKAALQKVSDQEEVVIRVSANDFDAVLFAKRDLQTMIGREHALKIIADSTIEGGSCIIDTSYGTVDARIDTQFDNIKKALQGVA